MGPELAVISSYLSQFVIPVTDFAFLEVFHDALLGSGIKIQQFQNRFL